MKGHRPSALPIARFCGLAPVLGAKHGAMRSAAMSNVFHKMCADEDGWRDHWDRLTEEEQAELVRWHRPKDIRFDDGVELLYKDAIKETRLGLDEGGAYIDPDSEDAVTAGTADFLWVLEEDGGAKTVYLADIKRGWFTQSNPRNLQNLAYGLAAADKHEADTLVLGLWYAEEGSWNWAAPIDMAGDIALQCTRAVLAAATNFSEEASTGAHCSDCYSRQHCPEWMIPPSVVMGTDEALLALSEPSSIQPHQALTLRRMYERAETFMKQTKEILRDYAKRNGGIEDPEARQVWSVGKKRGRPFLDKTALDRKYPGAIAEFTRQGKDAEEYRWRKIK